jgi:group I intron endonuclease
MDIKEQKNYFGIYCIECIITHIKYIGQTHENFYRRWTFHKWNLNNNHHNNKYLQNAWNKYGKDNFKFYVIEKFSVNQNISSDMLNNLEIKYIKQYDTYNNGFNLTIGGEGATGNILSESSKKKIGFKNKINMTGKKMSDETKKKMSDSHKGYVKTESHRKHLSESLTGYKRSEEQKEKCRKANEGSKQKTAKYTEDLIFNIRVDFLNGVSPHDLSIKYNIPYTYLYSGILSNNRWKCVNPDGWKEYIESKN